MRPSRITANVVGMMLFVQVILGGSAVVLNFPTIYHLVWGNIDLAVVVIADFVVQGILGLISLGSGLAVVVHLTNAFLLGIIVTF